MQDNLEHRLDQLSKEDHQLILLKLKELISNTSDTGISEKPKRLVAYIETEAHFDNIEVQNFLKKRLPDYMVPSAIHPISSIPLLPNGKLDRKNLKPIKKQEIHYESSPTVYITSPSEVETQLIKIWEDVLNFSPVLAEDNFFEIGGDSILSIQIIAKARKLGLELNANQLFEHQTIRKLSQFITPKEKSNSVEQQLISIWEEVLNVKPIHTDDNFFEIGGDSILSIQIIAKAKKIGLELSANQLFEHQTIDELLPLIASSTLKKKGSKSIVVGEVAMTPIQHWFFDTHKNAPQFWNQAFKILGIPHISEERFKNIAIDLITQHDALRSGFKENEGNWSRFLTDYKENSPSEYIDISNIPDIESCIKTHVSSIQKDFELSKGNLFKCIYFKASEPKDSIVVLLAHHLLVDAVSWQIIINDFKTLISSNDTEDNSLFEKTSSANKWGNYLNTYANSGDLKEEIKFWTNQTNEKPNLPVDIAFNKPILENSILVSQFTIDQQKTNNLLTKANKKFNTKIDELLIAALSITLSKWSASNVLNLGMERHGRETSINTEIDLSNSVGWFTSYFPVKLQLTSEDLDSNIKSVKEQLRQIPNKGIGYGILKYKNSNVAVDTITDYSPEVLFNYLGVNHQVKKTEELLAVETLDTISLRSNESERSYLFEINTFVQNNILNVNWSYSKDIHNSATITSLTTSFKRNLEDIIDYCLKDNDGAYTPSDFPEADLNQDDLDNLLDSL